MLKLLNFSRPGAATAEKSNLWLTIKKLKWNKKEWKWSSMTWTVNNMREYAIISMFINTQGFSSSMMLECSLERLKGIMLPHISLICFNNMSRLPLKTSNPKKACHKSQQSLKKFKLSLNKSYHRSQRNWELMRAFRKSKKIKKTKLIQKKR